MPFGTYTNAMRTGALPACGLGERGGHRIEERQRDGGPHAAQERSSWKRAACDEHQRSPPATSSPLPGLKWQAFDDLDEPWFGSGSRRPRRRDGCCRPSADRMASGPAAARRSASSASTCARTAAIARRGARASRRPSRTAGRRAACRCASTGNVAVRVAPPADRVVVLQPEAERIHVAMAGRARRIAPVHLELLAHRLRLGAGRLLERRHVGRRRRRRHAEEILQHVLAANHGRGARRIARDRQHARLAQHAAAAIGRQLDPAELGAGDTARCRSAPRAAR